MIIPFISHAEEITLGQLQGEWLNKKYIETLQLTKSPIKAVDGIYYTSFTIFKENNSYRWGQNYNFHEGIIFNIIELLPTFEPHNYQIVYEPIYEREPVDRETYCDTLYISGDKPFNEMEWIFTQIHGIPKGEKLRIPFVRVEPNIDEYVNRIVLAGTYTDKQGRTFVFSKSEEAQWPDKSFRYKVGLDYIFESCDFFWAYNDNDKYFPYAFSWQDDKLYIYNTYPHKEVPELKFERDDKPLYILTPQ
ncbi:hypothetical protein ACFL1R_10565 [Candidatus Latescibacterota bacterium]